MIFGLVNMWKSVYDMSEMTWHDVIWHDVMRRDVMWPDATWPDMVWNDMRWCDMIWFDITAYWSWCDMIMRQKGLVFCVLWSHPLVYVLWCLPLPAAQSRQIVRTCFELVTFQQQCLVWETQLWVGVETCRNHFVKPVGLVRWVWIGRIRVMDIWWFWNQAEKRLQKNEIKEHRNRIQIWTSKIWETPQLLFFFPPAENFKRWSLG